MMLPLAGVFLLLTLLLFWGAARRQQNMGLPGGRVIYADTRSWGPVEEPLYDPVLRLTGKPDYLVEKGKAVVPVEVKSGRTPQAPHEAHIFQLAAYCVLVERAFGVRPPYGILHYPKRTFAVDYSAALESALLDVIAEMRRAERRREVQRSHEQRSRCLRCGYHAQCDQSL